MMTDKLVNFTSVLCDYRTHNADYGDASADINTLRYGILTEYVQEMFDTLDSKCFNIDIRQLKLEIIAAYDRDERFWQAFNQDKFGRQYTYGDGYGDVAIRNWEEYFSDEFTLFTVWGNFYHADMLKLLVKMQIWDRIFPNEELPNYQVPKTGQLPHFGDNFKQKLTSWSPRINASD